MVLGRCSHRRYSGFTFIELLVVVGISVILIGLLAAGLVKARQAANQAKSIDNLRQLADAAIQCNGQWKKLPPGVGFFPGKDGPSETVYFWLLPYLQENARTFVAPGDPSAPVSNIFKNGLGPCSYAANGYVFSGDDGLPAKDIDPPPNCKNISSAIIPTTFRDGTANTILFMEKYARCSLVKNPREGYEEDGPGEHGWADATLVAKKIGTNGYYSNFTPIQLSWGSPQFQPDPLDADCKLPQGFARDHINVAMADGSTRLVSSWVPRLTWILLLLPNDNQAPPGDW
jgi:type II secretory pathway pseudopilin PulG